MPTWAWLCLGALFGTLVLRELSNLNRRLCAIQDDLADIKNRQFPEIRSTSEESMKALVMVASDYRRP